MMKTKVLIFIDWFTPGYKAGGPTRSMVNLIDQLKDEKEFFIVTRNTDYRETIPYPGITPDTWLKKEEYHILYLSSPSMRSIRNAMHLFLSGCIHPSVPASPNNHQRTGILYINGIWSFFFSILPLMCLRRNRFQKIIVAPRGMLSSQTWASAGWKKKPFLKFAALVKLYNGVLFHATDKGEEDDIRACIGKDAEILVLPNLTAKTSVSVPVKKKKNGEANFISIARIAPEKNTKFMLHVLQKGIDGNMSLDLYGPVYNEKYWEECKRIISMLPSNIRVTWHGSLSPAGMQEAMTESHFLFMPSLGENYGHSIVEAIQHGLPVLISDKTPWRELEKKGTGWDLPLHDPDSFRSVINRCISMGDAEYSAMREKCKDFAGRISGDVTLIQAYHSLLTP